VSRRRRALVLSVLAVLLGGLAASDVAGREAALRRAVGEPVPVLVTRVGVKAGQRLEPAMLAVRRVPARYAPPGAFSGAGDVVGERTAVPVPAGSDVTPAVLADPARDAGAEPPVGRGERVAELVATGSPALVTRGSRVDVLVTRETGAGAGETTLALEDAEVLSAAPAPAQNGGAPGPRVAVSLRVRLRDAVYLAAAQAFARELRVLPRAAGDRRRGAAGLRVGSGL
jgi:pilus assembly protein CpaB